MSTMRPASTAMSPSRTSGLPSNSRPPRNTVRVAFSVTASVAPGARHRAIARGADERRVLREHTLGIARFGRGPLGSAPIQLAGAHLEVEAAGVDVDRDRVPF